MTPSREKHERPRKLLSEAEAWRLAARRLDRSTVGIPFNSGLQAMRVDIATWLTMRDRITAHADDLLGTAYDGDSAENRAAGVLAMLWLALESESDSREAVV